MARRITTQSGSPVLPHCLLCRYIPMSFSNLRSVSLPNLGPLCHYLIRVPCRYIPMSFPSLNKIKVSIRSLLLANTGWVMKKVTFEWSDMKLMWQKSHIDYGREYDAHQCTVYAISVHDLSCVSPGFSGFLPLPQKLPVIELPKINCPKVWMMVCGVF